MDITNIDFIDDANDKLLGEKKEGIWLKNNAHRYGFILRYPEGKSDITGYNYEPWHFRYVGIKVATEIFNKGLVLEEYLGKTLIPNHDAETISLTDIINEYIPKPLNHVVYLDKLEYHGRWQGNVMPGLLREMEKNGWAQYDAMGAIKFYVKDINGKKIRISVAPTETGGPEEKDATTFVQFGLST